jgi:outer membrane protein assembly factor BamE (lipoprotein component of BamABCDE complex)
MSRFIAFLVCLFASAAALAAVDPDSLSSLKKGQSSEQVKAALGSSPLSEDHNPDGRFVYVYEYLSAKDPADKGYVTLLFGKDKKLLKLEAYKQNVSK